MSSALEPSRRRRYVAGIGTVVATTAITALSWLMIEGAIQVDLMGAGGIPESGPCPEGIQQPVVPSRVNISVYNSTNEPGLASEVADALEDRDFRITGSDNDYFGDTGFTAIIRAGEQGARQAYTLQQHAPGTIVDIDDRDGFGVDFVLGDDFLGLKPAEDVELEPGQLSC